MPPQSLPTSGFHVWIPRLEISLADGVLLADKIAIVARHSLVELLATSLHICLEDLLVENTNTMFSAHVLQRTRACNLEAIMQFTVSRYEFII
jgi:hypothetical protein